MTLGYTFNRKQRGTTQTARAKRPLHRAYSTLSILFALVLWAVVGVGVLQASPATVQYAVGWFYDATQTGTALHPVSSDSPVQPSAGPDEIGFERQLFAMINKMRIDKGLPPLKSNESLTRSARTHAKDMSKSSKFSITDDSGTLPAQRVALAGYAQSQSLHELISAGFPKPDQVIAALTANSNTVKILLGADINEIGVGYAYSPQDRIYQHYWTIDLGRRGGTNFTVVVSNGAESTTSAQVNLRIGGKEWAQQMLISNLPNFNGANWEPFSETKTWTLSEGTGPKKVYVKLRGAGNQEGVAIGEVGLVPLVKGSNPNPSHPTQNALLSPRAPTLRRIAGDIAATGATASGSTTSLSIAATSASLAPGYYQTSNFMLGKVAVGIVLPQCTGTIDKCTEAWNQTAMDQVTNQITTAMNWWTARMNGRVTFVLDQRRQATTGYEPINHPQSDESLWMGDVMSNLGFSGTSYFEQVYAYNNWMRQKYGTDWAFTIFVANSINNQSGAFSNGYFAYAYLPGPFMVTTYDNDGYGINNMAAVVAHETGHIFGALDEYPGAGVPCTDTSGYLIAQNQNSQVGCAINQDSIMRGGTGPFLSNQVDPYAMAMLGYRVSSGNLPDPINTKPVVTLDPVASPTNTNTPTITGVAQDQPYNPPTGDTVTINYITSVQYRVDGGAWQNALPSDGNASFNQVAEGFTFTPSLPNGGHTIQVQAINRANNVSDIVSMSLTVQGTTTQLTPIPPTPTPLPPTSTPTAVPFVPTATAIPTNAPTNTPAPSRGSLCALVYKDSNGNGKRDSNETRLVGAQIAVKNSSNQVVGTYTTDGVNEPHCFTNLPQGQYTVTEINPSGYTSTTSDVIAMPVIANIAFSTEFGDLVSAPAATATAPATFTPMPTATAIPTNAPTNTPAPSVGSLCVLVYNDLNGNGTRDSSETRLAGAQIAVKNSSSQVVGTYTTDGVNEPRCFANLPQGQYTVTEINPTGYTSTTSDVLATSVYAGFAFGLEFGNKLVAPTNTPTRAPTAAPTSGAAIDSPSGLKATATSGFVVLTWKASRASGVTYTVYRGASSTALTLRTTGITNLAYLDTQVAPGGSYYYYVVASKSGAESKPSNTVRVDAR